MRTLLRKLKRATLPSILIFLCSTFFSSCKKDQLEEYKSSTSSFQNQYLLQKIKKLGFHDSTIVDAGYAYIVEGDIVFPKDSTDAKSGKKQQWELGSRVSFNKQASITVHIDPSASTWANAINAAIAQWNNITTCRINFTVTTSTTADITIIASTAVGVADAEYPSNGNPGNRIRININWIGAPTLEQRRLIVQHELGHTIGFRHSDWYDRDGSGVSEGTTLPAYIIPGTPVADGASVMNCCDAGDTFNFSAFDITAARIMYPDPYNSFLVKRQYFNGPYNYTGYQFLTGDVSGDKKADVVGINPSDERLAVWQSQGPSPSFLGGQDWLNGPWDYTGYQFNLGDVTGDGRTDVVGVNPGDERLIVWISQGNSFLGGQEWYNGPYNYTGYKYLVGDVTGDGRADVVGVNLSDERFAVWPSQEGINFLGGQEWRNGPWDYSGYQLAIGDVTGDGKADIVGVNASDERLVVWKSEGTYFSAQDFLNGPYDRSGFKYHVADVTGDGKADVIGLGTGIEYYIVYQSQGNSFLAGQEWQNGGTNYSTYQFGVADAHGDGKADVIGINAADESFMVWQSLFIYY